MEKLVKDVLNKAIKNGLSRRDALKFLSLGGASLLFNQTELKAEVTKSSNAKVKIVIIGGGCGGLDSAARLKRALKNSEIILIEPNELHPYQPGYTLLAAGIYSLDYVLNHKESDYIPDGVKWIKDIAIEFEPDINSITTKNNGKIKYDILVVATGVVYDWEKIENLSKESLNKDGIYSVYDPHSAHLMFEYLKSIKDSNKIALYTDTYTPIKCGGAPKKVFLMHEDYIRNKGDRKKLEINFYSASEKMFSVPEFEKRLNQMCQERDIKTAFNHKLIGIDRNSKEAIFEKTVIIEKEVFNEILNEKIQVKESSKEIVRKRYDLLHVVPPMRAPDAVKNSNLAWDRGSAKEGGCVMVDKETLQHLKYKNVFAIGDVAGIPINKTGASIRKAAPKMVENIISVIENKEPTAKHNGYTACPILCNYGKVLLAEFGYDNVLLPTVPYLEPAKERWIWWVMKVYILKPLYYHGMLRGIA